MNPHEVTRVSFAVEIGGEVYHIDLPHDRMLILVQMAASLSDTGELPAKKSPGYQMQELPR
jgi:hypothetical protein